MKKIFIFFNLLLALIIGGCSSVSVNNVMGNISSSVEMSLNSISDFVNKLAASKPLCIFPAVPKSKYFEMDNYKIDIKYADNLGIETRVSAFFYNKTNSKMDIIIDFPIYDLYGNMVSKGIISRTVYGGTADTVSGWYDEYRFKKNLRIVQEQVRTRIYMNGKLIASAGNLNSSAAQKSSEKSSKSSNTNKSIQKKEIKKEAVSAKETEIVNSASPKPRQARQSIKK